MTDCALCDYPEAYHDSRDGCQVHSGEDWPFPALCDCPRYEPPEEN